MRRLRQFVHRQASALVCLACVAMVAAGTSVAMAQHKGNLLRPRYLSNAPPDQERGREILTNFRRLGLGGDYYLEFDLEILPRKGKRSVVPGQMWGLRDVSGPVFRANLMNSEGIVVDRLLGRTGLEPRSWRLQPETDMMARELDADTLLDPLGGTHLSMFEFQMPFVHWHHYDYEGTDRVRGRAAHAFLMHPPADFAAAHPNLAGVRLHLDARFHALMQAVFLDPDEQPFRKLTVLDLKKLGDQWIVKSIDVRDETTRDKVRFLVTGAALDLNLLPRLFTPEELAEDLAAPAMIERLKW